MLRFRHFALTATRPIKRQRPKPGLLHDTHAAGVVQHGPGRPSRSSHPAELARLCCLHRWPGPASFVQADAETQIWRRCHLIVSFLLERAHEKCVELRGFEPLTSCMPCKRSTN
jgi:hypothetical protein